MTDTCGVESDSVSPADQSSPGLPGPMSFVTTYLANLTSFTLHNLQSELTTFSNTSAQLTNAQTTFCTASYPLSSLLLLLPLHYLIVTIVKFDILLTTLPALQLSATTFTSTAALLLEERRHAPLVRDNAGPRSHTHV
jgi:hypothetical protein